MMVASVDTRTGRTILFGLPRNIQRAQFPPGSPMARQFPNGFHDASDPLSGDYLLNAVYAYAHSFPEVAPAGPDRRPRAEPAALDASRRCSACKLDYYVEVNMAGFASIIDALGGLTVDVGPEPLPVGGITPSGRHVKPDRYIPPGVAAPRRRGHPGRRPLAHELRRLHADGPPALPAAVRPAAEEPGRPADELPGRGRGDDEQRVDQHPAAGAAGAGQGGRQRRHAWRWRACRSTRTCADPERVERPVRHLAPRTSRTCGRSCRDTIAGPPAAAAPRRPPRRRPRTPQVRRRPAPAATAASAADDPSGADEGRHLPGAIRAERG